MVSERELAAAAVYWIELQQRACTQNNPSLQAALRRVGSDPPTTLILELYAEHIHGVRRLRGRGPLVYNGSRKPGNDKRR